MLSAMGRLLGLESRDLIEEIRIIDLVPVSRDTVDEEFLAEGEQHRQCVEPGGSEYAASTPVAGEPVFQIELRMSRTE